MKIKSLVGIGAAALVLAGCASPRGGSEETYDTLSGSDLLYQQDGSAAELSPGNWPVDNVFPKINRYDNPNRLRFPEIPLTVQ